MSALFEELDRQSSPMGDITLRRRLDPALQVDVYEVKLDDEYLMSSIYTGSEIQLAHLGLAAVSGTALDVVVGGLGLGYTARAVLTDARVRSLRVIEALAPVIGWHERRLLPLSPELLDDDRSQLEQADFFAWAGGEVELPGEGHSTFDAIIVDIDHSPNRLLHPDHGRFYTAAGMTRLSQRLRSDGAFALWSDDKPNTAMLDLLNTAFTGVASHVVEFPNPYGGNPSACTVYVAVKPE